MVRIGIDLGTTHSLGALVYDDGPHVIPRRASTVFPSAVAFDGPPETHPPLVGQEADRDLGAVRSIKRLMGRTWDEALREGSQRFFPPDGEHVRLARRGPSDLGLEIDLQGERRFFWPHEISAFVLRRVRSEAERRLGRSVDRAVIAVPASFKAPHRKATLDAARLAGLDVNPHDLLDEPTARDPGLRPGGGLRTRRARAGPRLGRAEAVLERCLDQVGVSRHDIRKILLVGGSSRIPAFQGAATACPLNSFRVSLRPRPRPKGTIPPQARPGASPAGGRRTGLDGSQAPWRT